MNRARFLASFASCIVMLVVSGCASLPTARELREMGKPEVAFLQQPDDLTIFEIDGGGSWTDHAECLLIAGPAICAVAQIQTNWYDRKSLVDKEGRLGAYENEITSLGFSDQAYRMYAEVVRDTGWLHDKDIHRVTWTRDEAFYTKQSHADCVVYIQPIFALNPDGRSFVVIVDVGIQQFSPGRPHDVYDIRKKEFYFTHRLSLMKTSASWEEKKEFALLVASMRREQAIPLWFADHGSQLRADFAVDMQQVNQGVRELFGSENQSPGK